MKIPYVADPVAVSTDAGEDGGLLAEVAAEARAKADDTVNLPGAVGVLAVQRAARVALIMWWREKTWTACP